MGQVYVFDHPLIQHKLTFIRDRNTGTKEFRELVNEVAALMAYEITRGLPLQEVKIETPVATAKCHTIAGKKIGLIPILRAGMGMLEGVVNLIPTAKIGQIGLYRDPNTLEAVEYYTKLPSDVKDRDLIVLDPMLATGGSAAKAIQIIKEHGGEQFKLMGLVGSPAGIERIKQEHPDVDIYLAAIDERLDEKGYIVPGLGDAGDRLYGTK